MRKNDSDIVIFTTAGILCLSIAFCLKLKKRK